MKRWHSWVIRLNIAAILVLIAVGMHRRMPLVPSACDQYTNQGDYPQKAPYYDCAAFDRFVLRPIGIGAGYIGSTVHDDRDDLTAWATLAIAAFTGTLWWVTWKMVRIAQQQRTDTLRAIKAAEDAAIAAANTVTAMREIDQRQAADFRASLAASEKAAGASMLTAEAVLGVELPRLELDSAGIAYASSIQSALEKGNITIGFKNHGRTPAHIIAECVEPPIDRIPSSLPLVPRYTFGRTRKAPMGTVINAGERHFISCEGRVHILPGDVQAICRDSMLLWLYGYVAYRDFLGGHWRTKFCLVFKSSPGGGRFEEADYPAYTGREKYDPNERADVSA